MISGANSCITQVNLQIRSAAADAAPANAAAAAAAAARGLFGCGEGQCIVAAAGKGRNEPTSLHSSYSLIGQSDEIARGMKKRLPVSKILVYMIMYFELKKTNDVCVSLASVKIIINIVEVMNLTEEELMQLPAEDREKILTLRTKLRNA